MNILYLNTDSIQPKTLNGNIYLHSTATGNIIAGAAATTTLFNIQAKSISLTGTTTTVGGNITVGANTITNPSIVLTGNTGNLTGSNLTCGVAGSSGSYSTSAITGDVVIRSSGSNNLLLQTGQGTYGLKLDSSNNIYCNGSIYPANGIYYVNKSFIIGGDNTFISTAISNPPNQNGICSGTGDGYSYTTFNTAICSWYGTGFVDSCFKTCKLIINNRTGDLTSLGSGSFANVNVSSTTTSAIFNTSSDYRIKSNIKPLEKTIDNLRPVSYQHKIIKKEAHGFIAHEVAEYFPELVVGEKDAVDEKGKPIHQSIDYIGLIAVLTKEIQEMKQNYILQQGEIHEMKQTFNEMKQNFNEMKQTTILQRGK